MPDESYADRATVLRPSESPPTAVRSRRAAGAAFADLPLGTVVLMQAANLWPLLHLAAVVATVWLLPGAWGWRLAAGGAMLYLLPPLAARVLRRLATASGERLALGERDFLLWWLSSCLQVLFLRLAFIEEALRLVPGLYSAWLRLWGSHVGRRTYWSPGVTILDRGHLHIGDDVVLAAGVRLNPHVIDRDADGRWWLYLAPVRIGDRAMVGGYSLLTAGTEIGAGEVTTATIISPPFSLWRDGRRHKRPFPTRPAPEDAP